jgi:hypothetical protein
LQDRRGVSAAFAKLVAAIEWVETLRQIPIVCSVVHRSIPGG